MKTKTWSNKGEIGFGFDLAGGLSSRVNLETEAPPGKTLLKVCCHKPCTQIAL